MRLKENNYAFIDSQNLHLGIKELGWLLDYKKFFVYLKEKHDVTKVYIFLGFIEKNQEMYRRLQEIGYILIFKPILIGPKGEVKGNVDADLVLRVMIDLNEYEKALIVTSDGDFYCLTDYLYSLNKLKLLISPCKKYCSRLLRKTARDKIAYLDYLKDKLQYIKMKEHR